MEHVGNPSTWESSRPYLSKLKAEREMRGEGRGGEKKRKEKRREGGKRKLRERNGQDQIPTANNGRSHTS